MSRSLLCSLHSSCLKFGDQYHQQVSLYQNTTLCTLSALPVTLTPSLYRSQLSLVLSLYNPQWLAAVEERVYPSCDLQSHDFSTFLPSTHRSIGLIAHQRSRQKLRLIRPYCSLWTHRNSCTIIWQVRHQH
jgi:hypothetical protein